MAEDSDELRTDTPGEEDGEGGPVKSFLEHLEDLRWVLIKSMVALGVAFIVCLVACDQVFNILTYPIRRAHIHYKTDTQVVTFLFDTNRLGVFKFRGAQRQALSLGTNQFVTFHLEPVPTLRNPGDIVDSVHDFMMSRAEALPSAGDTNRYLLVARKDFDSTEAQRFAMRITITTPAGAFIVAVQVAMYAGIILASPFILYFVTSFVFPALKMKEKRYVYRGMFYGLGLFLAGVAFCYFVLMPFALAASLTYTEWIGFEVPFWQGDGYISFVSKFMLGMGLGFEMPVILLVLVKIGVLNYSILSKARRYVIVANFILGAVLTTPEILTQVLMALPLQVLFEITVWIAWYWERKEKKRVAALEAAEAAGT